MPFPHVQDSSLLEGDFFSAFEAFECLIFTPLFFFCEILVAWERVTSGNESSFSRRPDMCPVKLQLLAVISEVKVLVKHIIKLGSGLLRRWCTDYLELLS